MPRLDQNYVQLNGGVIVWDGITRPEQNQAGDLQYNMKLVFPAGHPDIQALEQLGNECLQSSEFRGQLPAGAHWVTTPVADGEFGGMFNGGTCVRVKSKFVPTVYDENGGEMQPMQYGPLIYTGQIVNVVCNCYAYNNKSKGVAAGLDGFQIVQSANAQRLDIGGSGGGAARNAFGGQQPQQQQPQQQGWGNQQPQQQQPQQQGWGNQQPQQQQPQQQGWGNQQPQQQPQQQQPQQQPQQPQQQPQQQQGWGNQQPQQQDQGGYPQQSNDFMPGQN